MKRAEQPISAESAEQKRETTPSLEKETEYKKLLERVAEKRHLFWSYEDKLIMPQVEFEEAVSTMPYNAQSEIREARDLCLKLYGEGEPFYRFLIHQMDQDLNNGRQSDFYNKFQIFKRLPITHSEKALARWLDDERIWNNRDGSNASNILEALGKTSENEKIISAIERYIQNTRRPDYTRKEPERGLEDHDALKAASSLIRIEGRGAINRLRDFCSSSPHSNEWFLHNLSYLEHQAEETEKAQGHRQEIGDLDPSRISEFLEQNKQELERLKEKEKRERFEFQQQILIRGSAVLAQVLNKDKKLIRDIDIFLLKSGEKGQRFEVQEFKNIEEAKELFSENDFKKIKKWFKDSDYFKKPVHVVTTTESQLRQNDAFVDEPELIISDKHLDLLSKVLKPLSQKDYEILSKEIETTKRPLAWRQKQREILRDALEINKYSSGQLIRGKVPRILYPNGTLSRALRVVDIGKRFDIPVDDTLLRNADKETKDGSLVLSIKPKEVFDREIQFARQQPPDYQERPFGELVLDEVFMKLVSKKEQFKILKKEYPHLGTLVEKIQQAGGLESFIEEKFGKVYLQRGMIRLYDVDLSKSPASLAEQEAFLKLWDSYIERSVHFPFKNVKKVNEEIGVPESEEIKRRIDKDLLRRALRGRFASHLANSHGNYEIQLDKAMSIGARKKIDALLGVFHLCWNDAIKDSRVNLTTQLIKMGVHPRNPILGELDETKEHSIELVITDGPEAILGASTDKPWTSCVELGDSESRGLYEDVENGSLVAYLLKGKKFIGRVILRPTETLALTFQEYPEDAVGIEKYYGDERYEKALLEALKKIFDEKGIDYQKPSITIKSYPEAWSDKGTRDRGGHILYRSQRADRGY